MDAFSLGNTVKYLSDAGSVTLNIDERLNVELALHELQAAYNFEHLFLWGKIQGLDSDYYVAVGMNCHGKPEFPERRFFWASSQSLKFGELSAPKMQLAGVLNQLQVYFTGEHQRVLVDAMGFSSVGPLRAGSFQPGDIPQCGVTELDRLAFVVHSIEYECQIVPVGSYKRTPVSDIHKNEAFRGLKADEAVKLSSYMHFRKCEQKAKVDQTNRQDDIYVADFLDNANEVEGKELWTVGRDVTQTTACLRSRRWPGYYAFHRCNTPVFGGFYLGNGMKNCDLEFMV